MEYNFTDIEKFARDKWENEHVYKVENDYTKPKYYVLDMFPYPSGAGLHVGHPLGYIASDIFARYKRMIGFNVLHPMGFDEFGLPAEQHAIETGQHPANTTAKNTARYKEQLDNIGFSFDWSRKVGTSDPKYYKWTQWLFLQLFNSWYDRDQNKTRPIEELIRNFEKAGNASISNTTCDVKFTADEWKQFDEKTQRQILMDYRIAYLAYADVWWCEALGTVLANDEVVNGISERGGHPVEKKQMRQWFLRITEYADRLLESLDSLDWSDAMKEMQRNWIGKSVGAEVRFSSGEYAITVFTTRPDTIFGVDFMVLAPEHQLVAEITTEEQKEAVEQYIKYVKSRSERERISEVKQVTGCFTGANAQHPFTGRSIPIWISEYVLAGYGTGAIMAVPSGDDRDHAFAKHFGIPITNIFGDLYHGTAAYSEKTGVLQNSDFISGLVVKEAMDAVIAKLEQMGIGKKKVNFRLRDAGFSRQRYWGEPFPIVYIDDTPYGIDEIPELKERGLADLPVELPKVEKYSAGPEGQGPLANLEDWVNISLGEGKTARRETNTMPGYAGSSWYFLRYAEPKNEFEFANRLATDYWNQVDLYVGGSEHAVGHLLYSRMWTKAMYDLGLIGFDEPFKKLVNQGMIQGMSYFGKQIYFNGEDQPRYCSFNKAEEIFKNGSIEINEKKLILSEVYVNKGMGNIPNFRIRYAHNYVDSKNRLTVAQYICTLKDANNSEEDISWAIDRTIWDGIIENGESYFQCQPEIEKMSKSKYNVVNPDDVVGQYGADTFRMYEMFLGPVEMSKPWDTKGIEGVYRFLKKMWRLYYDEKNGWLVNDDEPTAEEMRTLHKTIKKITEDIEKFSFNTSISQFMISVNELTEAGCHKRKVLEPLVLLICPFAPHLAEKLWRELGHKTTVVKAKFPEYEESYLVENTKKYPIAINGKTRTEIEFALDAHEDYVKGTVLHDLIVQKWLEGKEPKKFIYVKGKMINVVI